MTALCVVLALALAAALLWGADQRAQRLGAQRDALLERARLDEVARIAQAALDRDATARRIDADADSAQREALVEWINRHGEHGP